MTQPKPFGQVAIQMGFVTEPQLQAALDIQKSMAASGRERRLLGMVMLEMGMISTDQLIDILKYYETLEHTSDTDDASAEDASAQ